MSLMWFFACLITSSENSLAAATAPLSLIIFAARKTIAAGMTISLPVFARPISCGEFARLVCITLVPSPK